jgi:mannose-6-phosphate isomerase-like protein (cupin superfamily)
MKNNDSDFLINESLNEYKNVIDARKTNDLSLSNYRVEKPWGHEVWLELNKFYAYKLISMKQGYKSSLQSHEFKYESNYIIEGHAEVLLENTMGEMESHLFVAGEGWTVPIGRKHRVIARTDYKALEVSTPHLNDVVRFEDDNNRESGKIKKEHGI